MEFSFEILFLFFVVATFAGCIDAIAGGGGLLTIPALLAAGVPPTAAIATNKLGASAGSLSSTLHFIRIKQVDVAHVYPMILTSLAGALAGSYLLTIIDNSSLKNVIPILLIGFSLYFLISPNIGDLDKKQLLPHGAYVAIVAPAIGFYDGFFGPGTGTFLAVSFVLLLGFNIIKATAHAKLLNFISNFSALLFFIAGGKILWGIGSVMLAGQLIGGQMGARLVVKSGKNLIKVVMVVVSIAITLKILMK